MRHLYAREEEFLDEFYNWAATAASALDGAWKPNYGCDDNARKQRDYFLSTRELSMLAFMSASIHEQSDGEPYAVILLESATRIVNVKVQRQAGVSVAEVILDRQR